MNEKCPKCGSEKIVPDAVIFGPGVAGIAVYENPEAMLLKNPNIQPLRAQFCGDCGYTELWTQKPQWLWRAHLRAVKRKTKA